MWTNSATARTGVDELSANLHITCGKSVGRAKARADCPRRKPVEPLKDYLRQGNLPQGFRSRARIVRYRHA